MPGKTRMKLIPRHFYTNRHMGISFIVHLLLIGLIAWTGVPLHKKGIPANFYEVEIVYGSPLGYSSSEGGGAKLQDKPETTLGEIEKEEMPDTFNPDQAQDQKTPPEDMNGINGSNMEHSTSPSPQSMAAGQGEGGLRWGGGIGQSTYLLDLWRARATSRSSRNPWSSQSAYLAILWKNQLMSLVQSIWRETSGNKFDDVALKATYRIRVSRKGDLLDTRLMIPSGNDQFDRSVTLALKKVTDLPQPPFAFANGQDSIEVTMSFPIYMLNVR